MRKRKIFLELLAVILMVGFTMGEADPGENIPLQGAQIAKVMGVPELPAAPQTIVLDPFYLIHEKGAKVWIERVIVTVEVSHDRQWASEFNKPGQRSRIFDILAVEPEKGPLPPLVKTVLNQSWAEAPITSVQLRRSFLLF